MTPVIDVDDVSVAVSAVVDPPVFTEISDITNYEATHGSEEPTEVRVFHQAEPHVRGGGKTDEYSMDGLLNLADANGQNVLREGYETGDPVLLRILPDGINGHYQPVIVTEYSDSGEADGDYVRVSFAARRAGARVGVGSES
jgi:hypothetical protein